MYTRIRLLWQDFVTIFTEDVFTEYTNERKHIH